MCRQVRWAEFIAHYDFQIVYCEGKSMGKPDALSRRPDHLEGRVETPKSLLQRHHFALSISTIKVLNDHTLTNRICTALDQDDSLKAILAYFCNRPQHAPAIFQKKIKDHYSL